jgi:hypothetical protein
MIKRLVSPEQHQTFDHEPGAPPKLELELELEQLTFARLLFPVIIAVMNEPIERVSATKRIAATAHQVFLAVTDPAWHVRIDGSACCRTRAASPD